MHEDRPGLRVLTVELISSSDPWERDSLLTDGVYAIVEFLVASSKTRDRAVVDVRLADDHPAALPGACAFVEAARGLVQAHTLEGGPEAGACNLMVSTADQHQARETTFAYLASDGGGFSWGATYDVRRG
ncbi:hypothetical protein [Sinomonas soli]